MDNTKLFAKMLQVMQDVSYLRKDDTVSTGQGRAYKAISEEKVTSTVGESLRKHGLLIFPVTINQKREDFDVVRSNGNTAIDRLTTVDVAYKIVDVESGEFETIVSSGTGMDSQDKGIGKALTYAYKYLLLRTFAIPTGEDPDKIASEDTARVEKLKEQIPPENTSGFIALSDLKTVMDSAVDLHGKDAKKCLEDLVRAFNVDKSTHLPNEMKAITDFIVKWNATILPFEVE